MKTQRKFGYNSYEPETMQRYRPSSRRPKSLRHPKKPCDYPKPPNEFIDADWCRVKIGKELLFTFGGVLSGISPITLTVDETTLLQVLANAV